MRKILILVVIIGIFTSGCSIKFGKKVSSGDIATPATTDTVMKTTPTPTLIPEIPPTATISPESVSLTGDTQPPDDTVSLLGGPAISPTPSSLPTPEPAAAEVIKQTRYSTPRYSFEPAAGWQMDAIDSDTLLIHITNDDGVYSGAANLSPYIYFQYTTDGISDTTRLVDVLMDMRSTFAGATIDEDEAMPVIDGLRGVGQFIEGNNDVTNYRAYIVVFPLQDGVLKGVFWGDKTAWRDIAPQLNAVLASLRFPKL